MKKTMKYVLLLFIVLNFNILITQALFDSELPNIRKTGDLLKIDNNNGAALKKSINKSNQKVIVFCTEYKKTSPAEVPEKNWLICNLNDDWSTAVRAGVGKILKESGIPETLEQTKIAYVYTELVISHFLYRYNDSNNEAQKFGDTFKDCIENKCANTRSSYAGYNNFVDMGNTLNLYNKAVEEYTEVTNLSVNIGPISKTEDSNNFYLSAPISCKYCDYYSNPSSNISGATVWYEDDHIKATIPKTLLIEGNNDVILYITGEKLIYEARNYTCGSYGTKRLQSITPLKTEKKSIQVIGSNNIQLNKNSKGWLEIDKKNNLGNPVYGATFTIYDGYNCDVNKIKTNIVSGTHPYELNAGNYSLKETYKSSNYYEDPDGTCVNFDITAGTTTTKSFINTLSCQHYLDEIVGNDGMATTLQEKENLIKLYRNEYDETQGDYSRFNGLLNFSNPSCSPVSCGFRDSQYSCTSGWINYNDKNDKTNNFSINNISCYNDTITIGDKYYYCLTDFSFKSPIETEIDKVLKYRASNPFTVNSGRFLLEYNSISPIMYGYVHKHCFIPDYPKSTSKAYISNLSKNGIAGSYYDYVTKFNWNNKDINGQNIDAQITRREDATLIYDPPLSNDENNSYNIIGDLTDSVGYDWVYEDYIYVFGRTIGYTFKPIYLKNGSGKYTYEECDECKKTAGLLTKFTNKLGSSITLNFKFETSREGKVLVYDNEYECTYNSEQQIITSDEENENYNLKLEFRTINTSNPFSGKIGNTRVTGSNWCQTDENGNIVTCSGDIDNQTINDNIINRNNSYNKTGDGPKYSIILTPSIIDQIRKDNNGKSYDDYNFTCKENGTMCISNYLTDLKTNYGLYIYNSKQRECVEGSQNSGC